MKKCIVVLGTERAFCQFPFAHNAQQLKSMVVGGGIAQDTPRMQVMDLQVLQ